MSYQDTLATLREASDTLLDSLDVALHAGSEACEMLDEFQREILQMLEELGDTKLDEVPTKLKALHELVVGYNDSASLQKEMAAQAKDGHAAHDAIKIYVDALSEYDDDQRTDAASDDEEDEDDDEDDDGDDGGGDGEAPPRKGSRSAPGRLLKWPWRMFS